MKEVSEKEAKKTTSFNEMKALPASLAVLENSNNSTTADIATSTTTANDSLPPKKRVKFDTHAAKVAAVARHQCYRVLRIIWGILVVP